MYDANIKNSYY